MTIVTNAHEAGYDEMYKSVVREDGYHFILPGEVVTTLAEFWNALDREWTPVVSSGHLVKPYYAPARRQETAAEVGYRASPMYPTIPELIAGKGYRFLRQGETITEEDEFWASGVGPWTPYGPQSPKIGTPMEVEFFFPGRKVAFTKVGAPSGPLKWRCGHGRDAGAKFCPVCIVFMRNIID